MEILISHEDEMLALGARLAQACGNNGAIIFLHGELGAGKTTLVRGFLRGLGHAGKVKSPTYALVEPYEIDQRHIYHFDLYRLASPEELEYLGIRDFLEKNAIFLVEWPERGAHYLPPPDIEISIDYAGSGRLVRFEPRTAAGENAAAQLAACLT